MGQVVAPLRSRRAHTRVVASELVGAKSCRATNLETEELCRSEIDLYMGPPHRRHKKRSQSCFAHSAEEAGISSKWLNESNIRTEPSASCTGGSGRFSLKYSKKQRACRMRERCRRRSSAACWQRGRECGGTSRMLSSAPAENLPLDFTHSHKRSEWTKGWSPNESLRHISAWHETFDMTSADLFPQLA